MFYISVIIPTYNRAKVLKRCLNSLREQTFKNFDVFVCDDGSTDETRSVVEDFNDHLNINWLYCENFGGPAKPRNMGIYASTSKYIAFLDADDWWFPTKLEISFYHLNKGYEFVYHDLKVVSENGKNPNKVFFMLARDLKEPVFEDLLKNGNGIVNSSVVTKRNLMLKINGFSENKNLIASEDYDAWLRLSKLSIKFYKIKSIQGYYFVGLDNISDSRKTIIFINEFIGLYFRNSKYGIFSIPLWMNLSLASAYYHQRKYFKSILQMIVVFIVNPHLTLKKILIKFLN